MTDGLRIGVIGMGRVGPAVASALRSSGHQIVAVHARGEESAERAAVMLPGIPLDTMDEVAARADLVFLAVPDGQISALALELAPRWRPGHVVAHLSGATSVEALAPASKVGAMTMAIHPAMTFSGTSLDVSRLAGCPIAVTASPLVMPLAELVAREIGGVPFPLEDSSRVVYHAALAHASNHLVTVISQARDLLTGVGIQDPGEFLRLLTTASLDGALEAGMGALTGPVVRGDIAVVDAHLAALGDTEVGRTYRALTGATIAELDNYRKETCDS